MPVMSMTTSSGSGDDKSQLRDGWHPAYLVAILDEATPDGWRMQASSPRMWRWVFAVWDKPADIPQGTPERLSAVSSQKFSPRSRGHDRPASKAYEWTTALLERQILPGEAVDLDPLMPLGCRVKLERKEEYANIRDLERWGEGDALLAPDVRQAIHALLHRDEGGAPPPAVPAASPPVTTWQAGPAVANF